ncbi:MAG TPA: hypothetical protein VKD19_03540 [Pseudolabrys sp.]|nr:hypothetical protein [Pseudolabrys sp.]
MKNFKRVTWLLRRREQFRSYPNWAAPFYGFNHEFPMCRLISVQLPIAAKAMLLIGALATMSAAANRFCVRSLHKIDAINAMVTQQVEPARLTLTEAKIAVEARHI